MDAGFARGGAVLIPIGPGPIPVSHSYLARGRYHALNNSNTWTARTLRAAGVPIPPVLTAANVLCQAGPLARIIRLRLDTVVSAERGFCTDCGMVKPIALAVFMLMINSNWVGCSTGGSAGLAPFRILST